MTHQINIFLLLFGALQGWMLSFWFLRNKQKRISNLWFGLFLFVIGLQLTLKVITKAWLFTEVPLIYEISYKLPYLVGPLLYLYIKARKTDTFSKTDLLHFAPFMVSFLFLAILPMVDWMNAFRWHPYTQAVVQLLSITFYGALCLRLGNPEFKRVIRMVVLAEAVIIITLAVMVMYYGRFPDVRLLFLALTVLIYWISYQALAKPDLFREVESTPVFSLGLRRKPRYAHSSLKEEESERIQRELLSCMKSEKFYLDPDLTIDALADKIGTSRHHLSQVLNEKLNKSYLDFICELRLEEARKRLADRSNFRFTIAAIALDVGFNSVSTFNDAFRKRFRTTPSRFRDQHLDQMSA